MGVPQLMRPALEIRLTNRPSLPATEESLDLRPSVPKSLAIWTH